MNRVAIHFDDTQFISHKDVTLQRSLGTFLIVKNSTKYQDFPNLSVQRQKTVQSVAHLVEMITIEKRNCEIGENTFQSRMFIFTWLAERRFMPREGLVKAISSQARRCSISRVQNCV